MVQWLRLCAPKAGGLGSIPAQGTRSHMPHATKRITKIPRATTKTLHSQINKQKINIKKPQIFLLDYNLPGSSVLEVFSRQQYWSGLPFPPPGDLPNLGDRTLHCRWILCLFNHFKLMNFMVSKLPSEKGFFFFAAPCTL